MDIDPELKFLIVIFLYWGMKWLTQEVIDYNEICKKRVNATKKLCKSGVELMNFSSKNKGAVSKEKTNELIEEEIKTWKEFLKYHPSCNDGGEHLMWLRNLLKD